MKSHTGLQPQQHKALVAECNKLSKEWFVEHRLDIDKIVLYTLSTFGWGETRLKRFYAKFIKVEDDLIKMYDNFFSSDFAAESELAKKGINVAEWYEELKERK